MKKETLKQAWSGLVWLRDILLDKDPFISTNQKIPPGHDVTVRGRNIQEVIDELSEWLLQEKTQPTKPSSDNALNKHRKTTTVDGKED